MRQHEWSLWEVSIRSKRGLEHKHCDSPYAVDVKQALQMACDVHTRQQGSVSIWVVSSAAVTASEPGGKPMLFDPMADKIYRHPTFYRLPDKVDRI